jgi:membrane dipeptidase
VKGAEAFEERPEVDRVARRLRVSRDAVELYLSIDVIDLHLDTFKWTRVFGYDMRRRHAPSPFGGAFFGHCDFPRALEARLTGATWIITTNPFKPALLRHRAFFRNLRRIRSIFEAASDRFALVRSVAEYRAARVAGKHGAFLGVQGGNAIDYDLRALDRLVDGSILRITLVHLSSSSLGTTSSPAARLEGHDGLTPRGREYVERLDALKIFVDLAHISRKAFFDAVEAHDKSLPLIVTHTGIASVYEHWRNVTDEQLRVVADTGGTIGIMFERGFLGPRNVSSATVIDHVARVIEVVGEDFVSLGSDYDGAIVPPSDLPTVLELPRLVQEMLNRGWSDTRIRKVLGGNFLRAVALMRG